MALADRANHRSSAFQTVSSVAKLPVPSLRCHYLLDDWGAFYRGSSGSAKFVSTGLVHVMLGEISSDKLRLYRRYLIAADVFCCWNSKQKRFQFTQGITRDVSVAGAYVLGDRSPAIGVQVELNILWPDIGFTNPRGHLVGTGTVLRVDSFGDASASRRVGFALSLRFHPAPDESLFEHWAHFVQLSSLSESNLPVPLPSPYMR